MATIQAGTNQASLPLQSNQCSSAKVCTSVKLTQIFHLGHYKELI